MTGWNQIRSALCLSLLTVFAVGCASTVDKNIEDAKFLLDQGKYTEAEVKARAAVEADPQNVDANFILASALIGVSFLGDQTYLEKIASIVDSSESGLNVFKAIVGNLNSENLTKLQEARDILIGIPEASKNPDVYLQLYVARLFEIAAVHFQIGSIVDADHPDVQCNADNTINAHDGIPDNFNPNALDAVQLARFRDNLDNAPSDAEAAGLPSDFGPSAAITEMSLALDASISNAGNDEAQGAIDFFNTEVGVSAAACTLPN